MEEAKVNSDFRDNELIEMTHWDKKLGKNIISMYPKVGGRLRLAHEDNEQLSIVAKCISEDLEGDILSKYVTFEATVTTKKGILTAIKTGNAFVKEKKTYKDKTYETISSNKEKLETISIARALRIAGYGVEFTGAEEMSDVSNSESPNESTNKGKSDAKTGENKQGGKPPATNGKADPSDEEQDDKPKDGKYKTTDDYITRINGGKLDDADKTIDTTSALVSWKRKHQPEINKMSKDKRDSIMAVYRERYMTLQAAEKVQDPNLAGLGNGEKEYKDPTA